MTGNLLLDWAIIAVSLFNTVLLLWLGLTVLLNAQRRSWGIWLVGGGLLVGGLFFISHSAILGYGFNLLGPGLNFWWRLGWLPVVISPLAWYVAILWYAGFWDDLPDQRPSPTSLRRQRYWLGLTGLLAVSLVGLLLFANPLPSFTQLAQLRLTATPAVSGLPLIILVYPLYIILCIGLSLNVLRQPLPSGRFMGDLARRRTRPWLMAASVMLLLVSLLVAWVMAWVVLTAQQPGSYAAMSLAVGWFDLVIASLIALSTLLMGQAIVSYELFTDKTLPRRGFFAHWRGAVLLAAGYALIVSASLTLHLRPVYSLLLTMMLMVAFLALSNWRSFVERDRAINRLRPFVASQGLYEQLLTPLPPPSSPRNGPPFYALCAEVLGAQQAYLFALGPLAPLVGAALAYPDNAPPPPIPPAPLLHTLSPQTMCLPLNPAQFNGAIWAIPLWSERGLIGLLLLGPKRDEGLYSQEEIEIARAAGERLIDTQASVELARRLMALQRQRLAQTQILDRQARRVLHDEVLPNLHAALLILTADHRPPTGDDLSTLNSHARQAGSPISLLTDIHRQISNLLHDMPPAPAFEVARLGLTIALRRAVEGEFSRAFDTVAWRIEPEAEAKAQTLPALTTEVLFYAAREAIRNAARHARGEGPLQLLISLRVQAGLELVIEDNGVGLTGEAASLGSGHGLALHSAMLAVVGGTLALADAPGGGAQVILALLPEVSE
jgi:signal transduction histidine kinase